jgi:hypothetical protein
MRATRRTPVDVESILKLMELGDYLLPYTIRAMCLLGIADEVGAEPVSVEEVAKATHTDPPSLYKAMSYLATRGIFAEPEPGQFVLTPPAALLRRDHPHSARDIFLSPVACTRAMEGLDHAIRTGEAAFDRVHGESMWAHFDRHPQDGVHFDRTMSGVTGMELLAIVRACDWSRFSTVVDVGGGNGAFLARLLDRYHAMRGILFDLPGVVAQAPAVLDAAGVIDRCEVVPGSFLRDPIPAGADAYVLKRILYSWSAPEATGILRRVRAAMRPDSSVFLLEAGRPADGSSALARRMDLLMFTLSAGGTRTLAEQEEILAGADLTTVRVATTPMFPIIEARAA